MNRAAHVVRTTVFIVCVAAIAQAQTIEEPPRPAEVTIAARARPRTVASNLRADPGASAEAAPPPAQTNQAPQGRQGFIIGIGGGVGIQRFYDPFLFVPIWEHKTSAITDFKVGYAPDDQWLLYYTNQVAWGDSAFFDAVGLSAFGVSYMLEPNSPSVYLTGAVGASVGLDIGTAPGDSGFGVSVGGGYEFARHFSAGGEWMSLDVGTANRTQVFAFTLDWLYY